MIYPWLQSIAARLQQLADNPPQALCISAVPGLGQLALAESFIQAILRTETPSLHPDYLSISPEAGKSIGIDTIREIQSFCLIMPTRASRKIVMIHSAESMTLAAQQAFLKTLEEPVVPLTFIILTSRLNQLLPTLRSRCQILALPSVPYSEANTWLAQQNITITPEAYALTDGAPLMVLHEEFQHRQSAFELIRRVLQGQSIAPDIIKQLIKASPLDVLSGFYYALMRERQFALLDSCIELRKKYIENPHLNWDMQCNAFILEVKSHAV